jgi:heme/copper-type cytochrome/quinol oxidase subunit 1
MPRLSRLFVRASLLYLLAGFTLGAVLLAAGGLADASRVPDLLNAERLLRAHAEFLLFGWIVQLTMGVAFWILPRLRPGPPRGNVTAARIAFALLNAGVLMVGLGPAFNLPGWLAPGGRLAEAGAAVAFALHFWPRIKPAEPAS